MLVEGPRDNYKKKRQENRRRKKAEVLLKQVNEPYGTSFWVKRRGGKSD